MELTLLCYNIHSGKTIFYRPSLHHIINFIRKQSPDIIALQEVHNNSGQGWQFNELSQALPMHGSFGGNIQIKDGLYGNATFTKPPITLSNQTFLPSEREQRGLLQTAIEVQGQPVYIFNTHLGLGRKERSNQLELIREIMVDCPYPCILMGDFNTTNPMALPDMVDIGKKTGKDSQATIFPLKKRIDFIFASSSFEILSYEVLSHISYSDHYPIKAKVRLR
ncbi:endonuclease/exonuclease/phosphatase family protein [Ammoniphilus sp. YIM 78166]|uniref:endonuclease/exonuclease/phosphatase family protein n=1 Tax=Ammoniphilus sp. YIM 78166 TaxID=1644106 RepID=UPI0010700FA3|nr:endonuclease/exonuclease/phosphatase family protein [Ammoniphilus sp. YIM 78166]